jgi:hypothetical protein
MVLAGIKSLLERIEGLFVQQIGFEESFLFSENSKGWSFFIIFTQKSSSLVS